MPSYLHIFFVLFRKMAPPRPRIRATTMTSVNSESEIQAYQKTVTLSDGEVERWRGKSQLCFRDAESEITRMIHPIK